MRSSERGHRATRFMGRVGETGPLAHGARMNKSAHTPSVRLAAVGFASLALLAWIGFVPGSMPSTLRFTADHPVRMVITANVAFLILVPLVPLLWRGPARVRWLAFLLFIFPSLTLAVTSLWFTLWIFPIRTS